MLECLQTKSGQTIGQRTKTDPKTSHINKTNAKNVNSRVKTAHIPPLAIMYIYKTNVFTKLGKIVTSRVFTSLFYFITIRKMRPPGSHVFKRTGSIFEINFLFTCFHYIHLEKTAPPTGGHFHDDWARLKTALPTGGNVFQRTGTTFELNQHIIKTNILRHFELDLGIIRTNLLTKFHEFHSQIRKTAPPTCG
ncbi:hypothetical protein DPMN_074120 [Dreissena polymorpha]|uniref:Uncharacterized protein n=1 Tax=Dreissena polymorpha TaxID=45954 RepID=A0A9D4BLC4_DREPO|nr:hypothetical protein DPMN_074120 [Dreissena polymorpha]